MHVEQLLIYLVLIFLGLCFGSFAGASMWRLRALQLMEDKDEGERVNMSEYNSLHKLTKASPLNDRSQCLHCSYKLRWYDMVPLVSWLVLKGKCRKCHKKIGYLEPMIELGLAVFFVASYVFWPYRLDSGVEVFHLVLWLLSGIVLAILFAYDAKWSMLPDKANYTFIGLGFCNALLVFFSASDKSDKIINILVSVIILSGIYLALYIISKGKWIGFGDIKLGLGLALMLADWKLAFIALFFANFIGCLIVIPGMVAGKIKRNSHVPFGPLLITGYVVAGLAGNYLVNIFFSSLV